MVIFFRGRIIEPVRQPSANSKDTHFLFFVKSNSSIRIVVVKNLLIISLKYY